MVVVNVMHTEYFRVFGVPALCTFCYQSSSSKGLSNSDVSSKFVCSVPNSTAFCATKNAGFGRGRLKCFPAIRTSAFNATVSTLVGFTFAGVRAVLSCLSSVRYVSKLGPTLLAGFGFSCYLCFPFARQRAILGGVKSIFGDVEHRPTMSTANFFSSSRFSHAA